MPVITFEGGLPMSLEQKEQMIKGFTQTANKISGLPEAALYVYLKENTLENFGVGGVLVSEGNKEK